MGDSTSNRATLRNKFELEKFRSKVIKSQPETESSPSNSNQKKKASEIEEIVKHMKRLPNYLEKGKPIPDRALSFGVMDWDLLETWQHRNHKHGFIINRDQIRSQQQTIPNPVTGRVWGRWDADSHTSTRDQICSPSSQNVHRVTLQSHFQDIKPVVLETNGNDSSKDNHAVSKSRSMSPLRRFSFSQSPSSSSKSKSKSPVSQKSTTDSNRGHTSPLRRIFDPIFPSKSHQSGETCNENSKNFKNSKEIRVDDDFKFSSFWKQALFQTTVKYDRLLFTFAVENNKDILAATVTSLHSIKDNDINNICLLYTFFTVQEVKKKTINWLSHGTKTDKDHGYVPNVTAQMKVSNSDYGTRDFVLFSVNSNVQPQEELEAIVVKSSRIANNGNDDDEERFETNVILPGGVHGVPMKGEPSPLIGRWRSGGVCDCGGWDVGCRLKTLTNQTSDKTRVNSRHELFFQGEVKNKRPIFSLSPLKEGIFSVDFNSSLSPLQAFSICISVVESGKTTTQKTQLRKHIHEEAPVIYTRIPRIKKTATGTVGFM